MDNTEKRNDESRFKVVRATEAAAEDTTDNSIDENENTNAPVSLIKEESAPVSLVKEDTAPTADSSDEDEDEIVFAGGEPRSPNWRFRSVTRAKKRSPLVPVLATFAVLCAGAAIGTVIWAVNKDKPAESGTVSSQSPTGANSGQISTAEKVSDSAADNSGVSEEPLEISGIVSL